MFMGAYYALLPCILWGIGNFCVCISAWASGVARSTELGNAKASQRGTSDRNRLPRFLYISTLSITGRVCESSWHCYLTVCQETFYLYVAALFYPLF